MSTEKIFGLEKSDKPYLITRPLVYLLKNI